MSLLNAQIFSVVKSVGMTGILLDTPTLMFFSCIIAYYAMSADTIPLDTMARNVKTGLGTITCLILFSFLPCLMYSDFQKWQHPFKQKK